MAGVADDDTFVQLPENCAELVLLVLDRLRGAADVVVDVLLGDREMADQIIDRPRQTAQLVFVDLDLVLRVGVQNSVDALA